MERGYPDSAGATLTVLSQIIAAHGGLDRWSRVNRLTLRLRIGGRVFATKFASTRTRSLTVQIDPRRPQATLGPFPSAGFTGEFDPDAVAIRRDDGAIECQRAIVRASDGRVRRKGRWDDLDVLYFLGYALWNYSVTPYLFTWPGFECRQGDDWRERDGERWRSLHVRFPPAFPTHSRDQTFYFDDRGWLRRLEYTADVFSTLARGVHLCSGHRTFDGLVFPTHRVVYPRGFGGRPITPVSVMEGWVDDVSVQLI